MVSAREGALCRSSACWSAAPRVKPDRSGWHPMGVRRSVRWAVAATWLLTLAVSALAADNLKLAPGLSFTDDSSDNFPIRGEDLTDAEEGEGLAACM